MWFPCELVATTAGENVQTTCCGQTCLGFSLTTPILEIPDILPSILTRTRFLVDEATLLTFPILLNSSAFVLHSLQTPTLPGSFGIFACVWKFLLLDHPAQCVPLVPCLYPRYSLGRPRDRV